MSNTTNNVTTGTKLMALYSATFKDIQDVLLENERELHIAKRDRKPAEIIDEYRSLSHTLTSELKQREARQ